MSARMFLNQDRIIRFCLWLALICNVIFWFSVRGTQQKWNNVPPTPDLDYIDLQGLGDSSFAYRMNGLMLQNLGDTGGRNTSLDKYNFERLTDWFFIQDHLDKKSNFTPYLASYYFGSVQKPELYRPVLGYLKEVGARGYGEKWRWLAHAVWMVRFRMNDLDKALELADTLSKTENTDVPIWVRQMPAFVMTAKGEKKAAYSLMLEILRSRGESLHPNEVNAMRAYMCERTLTAEEAAEDPLCQDVP